MIEEYKVKSRAVLRFQNFSLAPSFPSGFFITAMTTRQFARLTPFVLSLFLAACQSPTPPIARASGANASPRPVFHADKLAEIDSAINQAIADRRLPGGVLWLERNGVVYHKAYGHRALVPREENMTEDTIFDAASVTKVIATATSMMILIERGKVKLDATVQTYLPEFTGDGKDAITVRQLMTHTSGLRPDLTLRPRWSGYEKGIQLICQEKLRSTPGTAFVYSDINYITLGEIVHRVSGRMLNEFAAREIFQPLKMVDSGFLPPKSKLPRIAPTEQDKEEGLFRGVVHDPTARCMGGVAGHAGLFTTAADMARYARMILNEGTLDGVRILKPETVRLMTSVQSPPNVPSRRGLGWDIDSSFSRLRGDILPLGSFGHTGWTGTCLWIDPFSRTFWIFDSNRNHPTEAGNVTALRNKIGNLVGQAVVEFNFGHVPGALPPRAATVSERLPQAEVLNGIDVLKRQNFAPLKGLRIGLITNHTGTDRDRNQTIDLLHKASGVQLKALFSPEHGIRGALDEKVSDSVDEKTGLPVYSLYGERRIPTPEQLKNLDALVFDIQEIGCRFYTYVATMGNCMEAASKANLKYFVLDRVGPINGTAIEGPIYNGKSSFVAYHNVPLRFGMTMGELAKMFNAEKKLNAKLTVIPVEGWWRDYWYDQTSLPWTSPSPNMRNLTEAILYPGVGILEVAVSVGRGTDTPFEVVGAPYVDDRKFASEMNKAGIPGVRFVPIRFKPNASIFKDKDCGGVYIVLTDRDRCPVVDIGIVLAQTLYRLYPKEFAMDKLNTLLLHPSTVDAIRMGKTLAEIKQSWTPELDAFKKRREAFLMYK